MFKARIADPKILRHSIDTISNMIDEAGIAVEKDGLKLRAMDPAHVALVDFELKKEAFDEYEFKEPLTLGIDLDRLNTILKRGGNDSIGLEVDEEKNSLKITFKNNSLRTFNLPLIEVSEEELKVPSLSFPSTVEMPSGIIKEGIKDAEVVSDHVVLKTDKDFLYISAKGDIGNVEVKVSKEEAIDFSAEKEVSSMFSLEYLKDMVKASDIAQAVRLSLGENLPVKIDFIAEEARLSFLLAPRIESE